MEDDESKIDFHALAKEAAATAYNPRGKRCWWFFHQWTMWESDGQARVQLRRCTRCGKRQSHVLVKTCIHMWDTIQRVNIFADEEDKMPYAIKHHQRCRKCGDLRAIRL